MAEHKQLVFCLFLCFLSLTPKFAWSRVPSVLKLFSDDDNSNPLELVKDNEERFLYAVYRVGDLNRTIEFYTVCFGMQLFEKEDRPSLRYSYAVVGYGAQDTHFFLKLIYDYGVDSIDIGTGFGHFGILSLDANQTLDLVVANGGVVTMYPRTNGDGSVTAFVVDPSGYLFEITQTSSNNQSLIIDHINFSLTNLNRSIDFYQRALDLNLVRYYDIPEVSFTIALLSYGQIYQTTALELTYNGSATNFTHGNGYSHLAVSTDDVYQSAKVIRNVTRELGGRIIRPPGRLPGTHTYITAFLDLLGWKIVLLEKDNFLKEM
ncbi:hypothetical protein LguiA_023311 [Lonicera macranthoides]